MIFKLIIKLWLETWTHVTVHKQVSCMVYLSMLLLVTFILFTTININSWKLKVPNIDRHKLSIEIRISNCWWILWEVMPDNGPNMKLSLVHVTKIAGIHRVEGTCCIAPRVQTFGHLGHQAWLPAVREPRGHILEIGTILGHPDFWWYFVR